MTVSDPHPVAKERALFVAAGGTFVALLAYTVPIGALAHTVTGLDAGARARPWLMSAMSVGLAASLLPSGAVADARGRRKIFLAGAVVLALGSLGAAVARESVVFILARVVQGIGGAALTSCSLGTIAHTFPGGSERTRATGLWGASLGGGIAAGPVVAAGLDRAFDWRAGHWLCAAAALVVTGLAARWLPESRAAKPRPVDWIGAALLVGGIATLLVGLVEVRNQLATAILPLLAGAVLVVAFGASQARRRTTMLDLALFRRPDFNGATIGAFATGLSVISLMPFLPTLMAVGFGHDIVTASAVMLAWSGMSVVSAVAARRLPDRLSPQRRLALALGGVALGQGALATLDPTAPLWRILLPLLWVGLVSGVVNATLARLAVATVPDSSAAVGSGVNNTARYIGAAFGMTLVALVMRSREPALVVSSWNVAAWITAGFSALGAAAVQVCRPRRAMARSEATRT